MSNLRIPNPIGNDTAIIAQRRWLLSNGSRAVGLGDRVGTEWALNGLKLRQSVLWVLLKRDAAYYVTTVYGPTSAMVLTVWLSVRLGVGSALVQTAVPLVCLAGQMFLWTIVNLVIPHGAGSRALDTWFYLCLLFCFAGLTRALALAVAALLSNAAGERDCILSGGGGGSGRELLSGSQLARSTETAWAEPRYIGPAVPPNADRKRRLRRCADVVFFVAFASTFAAAAAAYWTVYLAWAARDRARMMRRLGDEMEEADLTGSLFQERYTAARMLSLLSADECRTLQPDQQQPQQLFCSACGDSIRDRYFLQTGECVWHDDCLKCAACGQPLDKEARCYCRHGAAYCREDYVR
uniref:LIM zinc-binding domain-containing protein n=1 Tax=Macrostomum lignano TaxID=282301 RepID=A0A1I8JQ25_9PLAT